MKAIVEFLNKSKVFYLATNSEGAPDKTNGNCNSI